MRRTILHRGLNRGVTIGLFLGLSCALPNIGRSDDNRSVPPPTEREVPPPGGSRKLDPIPSPGETNVTPPGRPLTPTSRGIFGAHASPPTPSSAIIDEQRRSETPERQWQFDAPYQINAAVH